MKTCSKCKSVKSLDQFYALGRLIGTGKGSWCKSCSNECSRKNRAATKRKHPAKVREQSREASRRYYERHPERRKASSVAYRKRNPDNRHNRDLRVKYGISIADYDRLLLSQGGHCALCSTTPEQNGKKQRLCVDHDHETRIVRGLLCDKHNRGIGLFGDDPEMLMKAIEYLVVSSISLAA